MIREPPHAGNQRHRVEVVVHERLAHDLLQAGVAVDARLAGFR
jgi:hypothetical protein